MNNTPNLFARFVDGMTSLTPSELADPRSIDRLSLQRVSVGTQSVEMMYAPFDHVNTDARLVVVGMTPGKQQASNALKAAQEALRSGATPSQAAEKAKVFASFSGEPMRGNLVQMLDLIGIPRALGISTTATLWREHARLIHFTSALRYPVFVDGKNWSGNPDMVRTPELRRWLEEYTGTELSNLKKAIFVPLGPKVAAALQHLAVRGTISAERILVGLPHPSGANSERISYFLGNKPAHLLSTKTNPHLLDEARDALKSRAARL